MVIDLLDVDDFSAAPGVTATTKENTREVQSGNRPDKAALQWAFKLVLAEDYDGGDDGCGIDIGPFVAYAHSRVFVEPAQPIERSAADDDLIASYSSFLDATEQAANCEPSAKL